MTLIMKTIIIGGGKVGYYLTKTLSDEGCDLSVIEISREAGQYFANTLDVPVVLGDGTSLVNLKKAGIENCETLIAVTGRDEVNLIVCQMAKRLFGVQKTVAKVNNPKNVDTMKTLGVDITVSSIDNITKILEREVDNSRIKELIPLNHGKAAVFEVIIPENYVYSGKMICDIKMPDSCNIISITRGDEFIVPRGKTKLMSNDVLLIVSAVSVAGEVRRLLKIKK